MHPADEPVCPNWGNRLLAQGDQEATSVNPDSETAAPWGPPAPFVRRGLGFLAGTAGILIAFLGLYAVRWKSYAGFSASLDTCSPG
jgi:hypothetical protein